MFIFKNKHLAVLSYCFFGVFLGGVVHQMWMSSKIESLQRVIEEQLEGTLTENARALSSLRDDIKTAQAQMVSPSEMREISKGVLSEYDSQTQTAISKFKEETGAQITSIAQRFSSMEIRLSRGRSEVGQGTPTKPAPEKWQGIKADQVGWCISSPSSCEVLPFTWNSENQVNGQSVASFEATNFWEQNFNLKLNLMFKVLTIGFSEADGEGAVQNQGVHIQAGYFDKEGRFVVLSEDRMLKGDSRIDPKFFYTPRVSPNNIKTATLGFFSPTFVVGVGYSLLRHDIGLLIGGGLLNFKRGDFRLGANAFINAEQISGGIFGSYHPRFANRSLNVAPMLGGLINKDLNWSLQFGLLFQVW